MSGGNTAGLVLGILALLLSPANAQPVLSGVASGSAQVSSSGATTIINQGSSRAIINWQDFSVPAGSAVQFNQPGSAAITLNRVTGGGASAIDGAVRANGQVWLLNPNGILFGQNARVDVGGLLATTSAIADQDFLAGRYDFSGGANAVINNGAIRAASGGSVVLSAPSVSNTGLIEANAGRVVLGGTESFAVDFNGDHLLSYAVGPSQAGSVSNSGIIRAKGGKVLMTARAAAGIADAVVNNSGIVEATSARVENGEIILDAGDGAATSSGTLDASGKEDGETGGAVTMLGNTVQLADNARIDVSGDAGGGEVLIGGNFQGTGPQPHAQTALIGKAAVTADAVRSGDGGKVAVWSDGLTDYSGAISARGGAGGGNGGQVETSGHDLRIRDGATVNTFAPQGSAGSWLLDPRRIDITTGGGASATTQTFASNQGTTQTVSPASIIAALQTGNVTLQANGDIYLNNDLIVTGGSGNTLTLQAGASIVFSGTSKITYSAGTVVLSANDPAAIAGDRGSAGSAVIAHNTGGSVSASKVDFILSSDGVDGSCIGCAFAPFTVLNSSPTYVKTLGANAYIGVGAGNSASIALGNTGHALAADMGTGSLTLTAAGVTQSKPISLKNLTINLPASISTGSSIVLTNTANALTGTFTATAMTSGTVTFFNSVGFTAGIINVTPNLTGNTTRGNVTLSNQTGSGDILLNGNIDATRVQINAANNLLQTVNGRIFAHATNSSAGSLLATTVTGDISLTSALNVLEPRIGNTGNGSETAIAQFGGLQTTSFGATTLNFNSPVILGAFALGTNSRAGGGYSLTVTGTTTLTDAGGKPVVTNNLLGLAAFLAVPAVLNNPITHVDVATTGGPITLHAAGDIFQVANLQDNISTMGAFTAISDHGSITLEAAFPFFNGSQNFDLSNVIGGVIQMTANEGSASLVNGYASLLGTSSAKGELAVKECTSLANCALHSVQDLTILAGATLTSQAGPGETGVVLAAQGNFINNSGANAIQLPNGGRWVIVSGSPDNDVFNGLDSHNTAVWDILNRQSVVSGNGLDVGGNRYAFVYRPTVTLTANTTTKPAGLDYTSQLGALYTISGLRPGVAGAFLGDTSAIYSGLPVLSSDGAAIGAGLGSYVLNIGAGNFTIANGYAISLQNGTLTVVPAVGAYTAPLTSFAAVTSAANAFTGNPVAGKIVLPTFDTVATVAPQLVAPVTQPPLAAPTRTTPLADLAAPPGGETQASSEPATASDGATDYVAASMQEDSAAPATNSGPSAGGVIIPGFLHAPAPPAPPTLTATGRLSGWGNAALWQ